MLMEKHKKIRISFTAKFHSQILPETGHPLLDIKEFRG
jgi:hypothetical protein